MDDEIKMSPTPATSPTTRPSITRTLTFPEALQEILSGERVSKEEWADEKKYGLMVDQELRLHMNGKDHYWVISEGDMLGTDYYVI